MTSPVRIILIDPFRCVVEHVDLILDHYLDFYSALSHETMPVTCLSELRLRVLAGHDLMMIDDEGKLKNPRRGFRIAGLHDAIAGKALIIGGDDEKGNTGPAVTDLAFIKLLTMFVEADGPFWKRASTPWSEAQ
ncbi:hypothetical protein BRAO375_3660038 [Bradyrhizobium sp. ORS 375]|uniref:hypothetical protein n=1 Tax=Bradyrhizobium sp. (strain ORS 375) TaxID=566679 RepID=UPI0002406986|nr:hypothetical protein [Bradyrhizobium sp. ORS 375]CCD94644.1 hypothetical protein BRAO375_3660038 [Bradyrhizobium sp. ORS 375]